MDQNLITSVKNIVNQNGYSSYLVAQAKLSSTVIISINNKCLMILNSKGNKVTNILSWLTLQSIKYSKPKLKLVFQKGKYSFIISNENIVKSVSEALQKILLSRELKSVGWNNLNLPSLPFSPFSAMNRILEKAHLQKIKIPQESTEKIFSILIYSQPECYINEIPNISTFIDIFLDAFPFFPDLYNIAISKMEKFDPYSVLINYVPYLKEIKRFEIIGPKSDSFSTFYQAFSKHQHIHLFSVSFRDSELDEKDLNVVHDFLIGRNIKGVEFHKAIKKEAIPAFFQYFYDSDLINNLRSLNISESSEIDINRLIPKMTNIQVLSLAKCQIEIGDTLKKLSSLTNLRILDLSSNPFRMKVMSMPPNLTSLYLNSVQWSDQTLFYFVSHLPNHYITLSMCNIQASAGEWGAFYNYLPTLHGNYGIESFAFDGNRVHQNLFSFLNENNRLYYLSLNGCFAENDTESIAALCKFVASSRSLEKLVVRGSQSLYLGRNVDPVIASTIQSKSVHYLDISDNRSGDFVISQLRQILLANNNIETLIFDGLLPNTKNQYIDFIRSAMNKKSLNLSFPHNDLMTLMTKKLISKQEFLEIKDLFTGRDETGTIFRKYPNYNVFPLYLRKDKLSELSDPIEIIENKPLNQPPKKSSNQIQSKDKPQTPNQKKNPNQNQQKKQQSLNQKHQQQIQQKNIQQQQQVQQKNIQQQQQQIQQQQIQQLQQQLYQQQLQQQQLQEQLQRQQLQQQQFQLQQQQQSPKKVDNKNINSNDSPKKKPIPQLNLNQPKKNTSPNRNNPGIEPTLIVEENDDYDQNDTYKYNTYDSYHSDTINNNKNNQLFDDYNDYDYGYNELDYSPIEDIKHQRLPARPKSATRYRSDMAQQKPQQSSSIKPKKRQPQSARKQPRAIARRRTQSVRRSNYDRENPKRTNITRNLTRNNNPGNNAKGNKVGRGGGQRKPNSARPTRSASACQMRRSTSNNKNKFNEKLDSCMNDSRNLDNNDYYSFYDDNEYEFDHITKKRIQNRPQSSNSNRPQRNLPKKNFSFNDYENDYYEYDETKEDNKNRIIKISRKGAKNNNSNEIDNADYSDDNDIIKNKPKPALRTKPKLRKKETTKKPPKRGTETKPSLKEFQKQNKMKLRQAQLKQQIQNLEDEDDYSFETKKVVNDTTSTVASPKDNNFDVENLETTYDIPTWNFPIKMKFEFDDSRTFKIEKTFSTEALIEEILKKATAQKVSKVSRKSSSSK